jgi:hypothetical protein
VGAEPIKSKLTTLGTTLEPRSGARALLALTVLAAGACASSPGATAGASAATVAAVATADTASSLDMNVLTPAEKAAGWKLLFDGVTTNGWRGFKRQDVPAGWVAQGGELRRVAAAGDLITKDQFQNFDLVFDWKIGYGGNSGVMYHVTEDGNETYETGPEYQLLDDPHYPDGKSLLTSAGSDFGIYPVTQRMAKPANQWNTSRIVVNGAHVEHWLNGVKVVDYELWSPDWKQRVENSKFKAWPGYGLAKYGYIALQDHEFPIAFRNVKIRVLP